MNERLPGSASSTDRIVDLEGLKALAHPLRVKILDELSVFGPLTASGLGERLGESSGATSYHLRQLEKHRFVREVVGRGTGRERWWERVPGGVTLPPPSEESTATERTASRLILHEMMSSRNRRLQDFADRAETELSSEWLNASTISLANIRLTPEQALELSGRLLAIIETYRGQTDPDVRPVQVHLNLFPVLDADPVPEGDPS